MKPTIDLTIQALLNDTNRILIISHVRPDGDAIGSLLGFGLALEEAGKHVQMVLADGVPSNFRHLDGVKKITRHPKSEFDLVVVVDCSDLSRIGEKLQNILIDINIDHHVTNLNFGRVNLVKPEAVATASILVDHLPKWGLNITTPVAQALLTGIVADTIGFRTSNMNPEALRQAAMLMEKGADLSLLYHRTLIHRSFESAQYWGCGLEHLKREGRLIWTVLSLEDRRKVGYPGNDDADLVNVLSSIENSDVAVIFIEQKDGRVKVSWRSQNGVDVSQIALRYGGGGHPAASGAEISGGLQSIQEMVLQVTRELILASTPKNNGNLKEG